MFDSTSYLLESYFFQNTQHSLEEILGAVERGISSINTAYLSILNNIDDKLKKPIVMSPPFYWAQSLNQIEFEIKFAYRHDVAGCADLRPDPRGGHGPTADRHPGARPRARCRDPARRRHDRLVAVARARLTRSP